MPDAKFLFDLAMRVLESGDVDEVVTFLLKWAAELEPSELYVRSGAMMLVRLGKPEKAAEMIRPLESSTDPDTLNALAVVSAANFEYAPALEALARALTLKPTEARLYMNRAAIEYMDERYAPAAEDLARAIVLSHFYPDILFYQSEVAYMSLPFTCRSVASLVKKADPKWTRALELVYAAASFNGIDKHRPANLEAPLRGDELDWVALTLLAVRAERDKKEEQAKEHLAKACALRPDEPALMYRRFKDAALDGKEKLEIIEKLVSRFPHWIEGLCEHARQLLVSRRKDEALEAIQRVLDEDSENPEGLEIRSGLLEAKGDLQGALRDLNVLIDLYGSQGSSDDEEPEDEDDFSWEEEILLRRGEVLEKLGQIEMARQDFDRAVGLSPREYNFGPYFERAEFLARQAEYDKAIEDITHAIDMFPMFGKLYADRAVWLRKTGDIKGAERDEAKAKELEPKQGKPGKPKRDKE